MNTYIRSMPALAAVVLHSMEGEGSPAEAPKTDTPAEAPKADAQREAPKAQTGTDATKPAAKSATSPAKGKTSTPATKKAAPAAPTKRESKIAPVQAQVVSMLKKGSLTVQAMSAKLEKSEKEIRQAIDRARAHGEKINRVARNTFGYEKPRRA